MLYSPAEHVNCERSVSGAEIGAERAENRLGKSGAVTGLKWPLKRTEFCDESQSIIKSS